MMRMMVSIGHVAHENMNKSKHTSNFTGFFSCVSLTLRLMLAFDGNDTLNWSYDETATIYTR